MLADAMLNYQCSWIDAKPDAHRPNHEEFRRAVECTGTLVGADAVLVIDGGDSNGRRFSGQFTIPRTEVRSNPTWASEAEAIFHECCRANKGCDAFLAS